MINIRFVVAKAIYRDEIGAPTSSPFNAQLWEVKLNKRSSPHLYTGQSALVLICAFLPVKKFAGKND